MPRVQTKNQTQSFGTWLSCLWLPNQLMAAKTKTLHKDNVNVNSTSKDFPSKNLHPTSVNREASWANERAECWSDQSWNNNTSVLQLEDAAAESDGWSLKLCSVHLTANKRLCLWRRLYPATQLLTKQMALGSPILPQKRKKNSIETWGLVSWSIIENLLKKESRLFLDRQMDWGTFRNILEQIQLTKMYDLKNVII